MNNSLKLSEGLRGTLEKANNFNTVNMMDTLDSNIR
jgi:hypothetical protein